MLYQETWNLSPCEAAAGGAHPPGRLDAFSEKNKHGSPCPSCLLLSQDVPGQAGGLGALGPAMQGESRKKQDGWRGELLSTRTRISADSPFQQRRTWGLHKRGAPLQGASAPNQQEDAPHVKLCPPAAWKPLPSPGAGGAVALTSSKAHVGQPRSADTNRTQSKRSNIS